MLVALSTMAIGLAGCAVDRITNVDGEVRSRTIATFLGQELDITLGNVGPAVFADPPLVSSPAVAYFGVDIVPPYTPAGPTQRFRFRTVMRGTAIIEFHRVLGDSVIAIVQDTVQVR